MELLELNLLLVLVSRSGIIPISNPRHRTNGANCYRCCNIIGVIAIDESDPVTLESKGKAQKDYTSFCS
jgi:amidase